MPFLSIIVPIYDDAYLAEDFCIEFQKTFVEYLAKEDLGSDVELIFVNDGSTNNSIDILKDVGKRYSFVKIIDLSRNFGQHIALSCGYQFAKGDYVGMLNVDMQESPSQIPHLLNYFKNNDVDIVYGLRTYRYSSWSDRLTSYLFNILLNKLTRSNPPLNISTLRVMNRKFVDAYNSLSEKSRYLPGLETWLGFKQGYVSILHQDRERGESSYSLKKRFLMATDSIISFSDIPLKLIAVFGILTAFTGFILSVILMLAKLFSVKYQPGYTSTISIITFIGGIQILVIGLASLYIGRILKEVQNRPLFVIRDKYNF